MCDSPAAVKSLQKFWANASDSSPGHTHRVRAKSSPTIRGVTLANVRESYSQSCEKDQSKTSRSDAPRSTSLPKSGIIKSRAEFWSGVSDDKAQEPQNQHHTHRKMSLEGIRDRQKFFETVNDEELIRKKRERASRIKEQAMPSISDKAQFWENVTEVVEQVKDSRQRLASGGSSLPKWEPNKHDHEEEEEATAAAHSAESAKLKNEIWHKVCEQEERMRSEPLVQPGKKEDLVTLCDTIYAHGEKYEDGTAALDLDELQQAMLTTPVNLPQALVRARKLKLLYFDGDMINYQRNSYDDFDDFVVLQKPIEEIRRMCL